MNQKPIAYADPSGYVIPVPHNADMSVHAQTKLLTPLYTQEQVRDFMAYFEASQAAVSVTNTVPAVEQQIAATKQERVMNSKVYTGVSVAEAATAALQRSIGVN